MDNRPRRRPEGSVLVEEAGIAVLVLMGVSGSGKSTVARLLAQRLWWDFCEGDDLHSESNVRKMTAGIPLSDEDRLPWLGLIADWIDRQRAANLRSVITCSALKRSYRDRLAGAGVVFVHLSCDHDLVAMRMQGRAAHFMSPSPLDSQFGVLEPLEPDENGIVIDAARMLPTAVEDIIDRLGLAVPDSRPERSETHD